MKVINDSGFNLGIKSCVRAIMVGTNNYDDYTNSWGNEMIVALTN